MADEYVIGIHYTGPLNADQIAKGRAFVDALGLEVNGEDGAVYARKIVTVYSDEDVDL